MRPGPPTSVLASPVAMGVEVSVRRAGRVLATHVPVTDVRLEWTTSRVVPAQLTYHAPLDWAPQAPLDPLARFGQRSLVTVVCQDATGSVWHTPLGQFVHTAWKVTGSGVEVTAADLMQTLEDDPMAWPSSPPSGATLRGELQRLAGTLPVVLDDGVLDRPVPVTAQWGCSRTEAVLKLAQSHACGLRVGADGCLHAYPLRDAARSDVSYQTHRLHGGGVGNGLLLDAPPPTGSGGRRPNRWVVTGSARQGDRDVRWTATRTATSVPFDPGAYGWVTSHQDLSSAASQEDVNRAVDAAMRADLAAVASRSIEVVPDPRIEVGDIVGVTSETETFVGRVAAYSLPLTDVGASMRIDLDTLEW